MSSCAVIAYVTVLVHEQLAKAVISAADTSVDPLASNSRHAKGLTFS